MLLSPSQGSEAYCHSMQVHYKCRVDSLDQRSSRENYRIIICGCTADILDPLDYNSSEIE
jgi:hypothetical protein